MTGTVMQDGRPPAALYRGSVMHARLRPAAHRFRYRVMALVVDIDRLAEINRLSPLFSVGRFNLWSFSERDHGAGDGSALRPWVEQLLAAAGVALSGGGRIELLCTPRLLGYVFDPLSVYFCRHHDGRLAAVVYAVRNTFGERHAYVCPVRDGELTAAGVRQEADKRFFVSPFNPMRQRYRFRVRPPADDVAVRILETDDDGPLLAATLHGKRAALATGALARAFLAMPLMTVKVMAAIHFEALRLWLKGVPLALAQHRPVEAPASLDGTFLPAGGIGKATGVPSSTAQAPS